VEALPNPVSVSDLAERFRPLTDQEQANAQGLLDDAWELLTFRVPDLEARIASGALPVGLVRYVMRESLIPVLRNPDGYRQWSVDDASFTRDNSVAAGRLSIADDLVSLLLPNASTRRGAFTIAPHQETPRTPGSEAEYIDQLRYGCRW
jgi:hypothetical protein